MAATKHLKTDSAKTQSVEFQCDAPTSSLKLPPAHYADTMSSSSSWMASGAVGRSGRANTAAVPNAYRTTSAR